ncbi:histidine kinase [Solirubrobacter ginsenosidimutans]|uniref:histidine kinase n=1 Tax=Solirubrobacter ginsenosidimutans TaxID=490573 RepID=A0A9X3MRE9_9ACTN|nr:histidine kinase [Solirubrobacter ginsenosidimutans]MDA0161586.1 histidine kinase [Solirubrobacter ginsenosidimutans]
MSWVFVPFLVAGILTPAVVGLFVALRRPGNPVAWILLLGSLSVAVVMIASAVAEHEGDTTLGRWAATVAAPWPVIFLWPLALAFVFPDGALPSRRWRPVAWAAAFDGAGIVFLLIFAETHYVDGGDLPSPLPLRIGDWAIPIFWVFWAGLLLSLFAGAAAMRARYKAGDDLLRRQVLWLAYGALLIPTWLGGTSLLGVIGFSSDATDAVTLTILQAWPAIAVLIAITRHGLYSIDRLVNRTLVYVALTALLVATYALALLLAGLLIGGSKLTASLATVAAALAFLPLRDRLQTLVDRRFARRRFEAVRLVRDFLDEVRDGHAEPEDVGAVLALALGDPGATLLFGLPETAAYADRHGRIVELPEDGRERSVIGRDLGVLLHAPAAPDLLRSVLDVAAVPVELARLRVELRLQLAEVESSRARIAQAGYEERRRLERDLHDGAQQRLVTLGIVLRRLQRSLPREAQMLVPALDAAVDEVAASIADLRTIAAGVRPPRLDEGLAAALADLARGAAIPVEVAATEDRAPPEIEATAYFVACEALTNAVKHASPSRVVVETARENDVLRMTIADDGVGGAVALPGMRDRVAAQGGTLAIESPPGSGTRIAVELPCGS